MKKIFNQLLGFVIFFMILTIIFMGVYFDLTYEGRNKAPVSHDISIEVMKDSFKICGEGGHVEYYEKSIVKSFTIDKETKEIKVNVK